MTYKDLHTDKVQITRWNSKNESVLLTGAYDGTMRVLDVRTTGNQPKASLPKATFGDVESA